MTKEKYIPGDLSQVGKAVDMTNQVPQEEWEEQFQNVYRASIIDSSNPYGYKLKAFFRTHLSQAREQGRKEGYMEAVEVIERYTPYAMGCTGCRTRTLEELARLDKTLKAKLESKESN